MNKKIRRHVPINCFPTQISWYKIDPSSSSSSGDAPRPTLSTSAASSRRRHLRPGSDGVDISIHDYSDGLVSSSVSVPAVGEGDYGTYRCGDTTTKEQFKILAKWQMPEIDGNRFGKESRLLLFWPFFWLQINKFLKYPVQQRFAKYAWHKYLLFF